MTALASNNSAACSGNVVSLKSQGQFPSYFVAGAIVNVTGVSVAGYNGTFTIASAAGNTLTYNVGACPGSNGNNGNASIYGAVCSGSTATITLTTALQSQFVPGNTAVISGVGSVPYNGSFTIGSTAANNFQFAYNIGSCSGTTNSGAGTATQTIGVTQITGATTITCTVGTAASCVDPANTATVNAGDMVVVLGKNNSGTASASETLGDIRVSLEKQ